MKAVKNKSSNYAKKFNKNVNMTKKINQRKSYGRRGGTVL